MIRAKKQGQERGKGVGWALHFWWDRELGTLGELKGHTSGGNVQTIGTRSALYSQTNWGGGLCHGGPHLHSRQHVWLVQLGLFLPQP